MSTAGPGAIDLAAIARVGRVHFMGIAGAGMSALAEWLRRSGGHVDGCDTAPGEVANHLRGLGIAVERDHDPAHVSDAAAVVATAAVPADHEELVAARARGVPVCKRSIALASVVNRGVVAAISGTHGKTTTTAMTTAILSEAGVDPTGFVGGTVAGWGGGLRPGADRTFVVEADEYDRAFLELRPHAAVITSVEPDHLDVYGSFEGVLDAFHAFARLVPEGGIVAACADDAGARRILEQVGPTGLAYGTGETASLRAVDVVPDAAGSEFELHSDGRPLGRMTVGVAGEHNVRNALGAIAVSLHLGADLDAARRALAAFRGVGRRFERFDAGDVVVIDDYAHHPTEIAATLSTARHVYRGRRLVAAFQPHLYTRTRDFAGAFGAALAAADEVWLTDIYPAREAPLPGVTAGLVADAARAAGAAHVYYAPTLDDLADALVEGLRPGDVLVAMGAGSIDNATRAITRRLRDRTSRPA